MSFGFGPHHPLHFLLNLQNTLGTLYDACLGFHAAAAKGAVCQNKSTAWDGERDAASIHLWWDGPGFLSVLRRLPSSSSPV